MAVFHPHANDPSVKTRLLEFLSVLIILASVPAWLGGAIAFFVALYSLALGLWGLFAWPRRHAILSALFALALIAFCIVNIILAATHTGTCVPEFGNSSTGFVNGNGNNNNLIRVRDRWCGSRLAVYITHGILIFLMIPFFILALIISREEREWEKGNHRTLGNKNAGTTGTTTTTGNTLGGARY